MELMTITTASVYYKIRGQRVGLLSLGDEVYSAIEHYGKYYFLSKENRVER